MTAPFQLGAVVEKLSGDYFFRGVVVALFQKRNGPWRIVVENDDGVLHIFAPSQLTLVKGGG